MPVHLGCGVSVSPGPVLPGPAAHVVRAAAEGRLLSMSGSVARLVSPRGDVLVTVDVASGAVSCRPAESDPVAEQELSGHVVHLDPRAAQDLCNLWGLSL